MAVWAILLAAGRGTRMQGAVADKVLTRLGGRTVLSYSLQAMASASCFEGIVLVHRDEAQMLRLVAAASVVPGLPTLGWAQGGQERADSVANALAVVPKSATAVVLHDTARPLATPDQFQALAKAAAGGACATLARRVTDTIKRVPAADAQSELPFATSLEDLARNRLWAMETPQAFPRATLARAYAQRTPATTWTDDTAAVASLGEAVTLLEATTPNPKLTTLQDVAWCEFLLEQRAQATD